ncbi:MAG TPA: YdcF family protein, partial [Pyrinomonadaceae bacterium]|nr:YdcF family protein [Pyrinomonadaceae bacterium]
YRRGRVHKIIFTGGQGNPNEPTEAAAARTYAVSNGISPSDILIEQRSHTTYENLVYAKQLADTHGLKKVLIVSDPMHMKRAIAMAEDVGLEAYPSPTLTTRYTGFRSQVEELTRETFYYLGYTISSFLRMPSVQSAVSAVPEKVSLSNTDFDNHVAQLKQRLPSKDFSIVVQRPFVVIGDEPESVVKERAEGTVKWAVEKLKQDFFTQDPKDILDIWLFKDEASYKRHARQLFNDTPSTPYGYYSRQNKALIMNISTGGGTLVHEIVHPFIEANFPKAPPWLNEGLGSLYEQCGEKDGHIYGYVNWRLPGLQTAIKVDETVSFKKLMEMDFNDFYGQATGVNYAQSRYLLYYLQEKGLLVNFYKQFHANRKTDPSGYETLKSLVGETDMHQFQRKWEKFVLELNQEFSLTLAN